MIGLGGAYSTLHTHVSHTPPYSYPALPSSYIPISNWILYYEKMCVVYVSVYGLGERRCRVKFYYAGKVGYATLRPDLLKS